VAGSTFSSAPQSGCARQVDQREFGTIRLDYGARYLSPKHDRYRRDPVTRPSQLELALLPLKRHSTERYTITSSAMSRTFGGILRTSALAVLRLMISDWLLNGEVGGTGALEDAVGVGCRMCVHPD
jgi:hypothetical protein